jgi:hypothetical protein
MISVSTSMMVAVFSSLSGKGSHGLKWPGRTETIAWSEHLLESEHRLALSLSAIPTAQDAADDVSTKVTWVQ